MTKLSKTNELIFHLGDKYYIIGSYECKECDDDDILNHYKKFLLLTSSEEFINQDVKELHIDLRNDIADVYEYIFQKCHVWKDNMNNEKIIQREELEGKYATEIANQFTILMKADDCLTLKKIDELHANNL